MNILVKKNRVQNFRPGGRGLLVVSWDRPKCTYVLNYKLNILSYFKVFIKEQNSYFLLCHWVSIHRVCSTRRLTDLTSWSFFYIIAFVLGEIVVYFVCRFIRVRTYDINNFGGINFACE